MLLDLDTEIDTPLLWSLTLALALGVAFTPLHNADTGNCKFETAPGVIPENWSGSDP